MWTDLLHTNEKDAIQAARSRATISGATRASDGSYATTLYEDPAATLDDLREAVATLLEIEQTARRVFGGAHPDTAKVERHVQNARARLRARETQSAAG